MSKDKCCLVYFKDGTHEIWHHLPNMAHFEEGTRFFECPDETPIIDVAEMISCLNKYSAGWNKFSHTPFTEAKLDKGALSEFFPKS